MTCLRLKSVEVVKEQPRVTEGYIHTIKKKKKKHAREELIKRGVYSEVLKQNLYIHLNVFSVSVYTHALMTNNEQVISLHFLPMKLPSNTFLVLFTYSFSTSSLVKEMNNAAVERQVEITQVILEQVKKELREGGGFIFYYFSSNLL